MGRTPQSKHITCHTKIPINPVTEICNVTLLQQRLAPISSRAYKPIHYSLPLANLNMWVVCGEWWMVIIAITILYLQFPFFFFFFFGCSIHGINFFLLFIIVERKNMLLVLNLKLGAQIRKKKDKNATFCENFQRIKQRILTPKIK